MRHEMHISPAIIFEQALAPGCYAGKVMQMTLSRRVCCYTHCIRGLRRSSWRTRARGCCFSEPRSTGSEYRCLKHASNFTTKRLKAFLVAQLNYSASYAKSAKRSQTATHASAQAPRRLPLTLSFERAFRLLL